MKMKYYLIFLVLILSPFFNYKTMAQRCLEFNYDADGNRIERAVSYNCDDMRDVLKVQEITEAKEICVYPNPTNGSFKIVVPKCVKSEMSNYEIYDLNGVMVYEGRLHEMETEIDMGCCSTGVYLLKITNGDDVISKIILKR